MLPEWALVQAGCRSWSCFVTGRLDGAGEVGGLAAWVSPASQGLRTFVTPKAGFLATLFQLKPRTNIFPRSDPFSSPNIIQHVTQDTIFMSGKCSNVAQEG